MKKTLVIFLVLIVISLITYFALDRQLYYYGKSNFNFYQSLPLKIKPQYWGYDMGNLGFVLVDESAMTLISKGDCQYLGSDLKFTIKQIIKYGYTNERLVAEVKDTLGEKYFIECLKNDDVHSKQNMIINVWQQKIPLNIKEYKWIEIKEAYFEKIERIRNYLVITIVVLLLISAYLVLSLRRKKT
jgi:hypothetical protein